MPIAPPPTRVSAPPKNDSKIEIRDSVWSDAQRMAELAQRAYWDTVLSAMLAPLRGVYPEDNLRGNTQRVMARMWSPRNRGFVAISDGEIIGYMQCVRLGDDEGAMMVESEKKTWWMGLAAWGWRLYIKGLEWLRPDRSKSEEGLAMFLKANAAEDEKYWKN